MGRSAKKAFRWPKAAQIAPAQEAFVPPTRWRRSTQTSQADPGEVQAVNPRCGELRTWLILSFLITGHAAMVHQDGPDKVNPADNGIGGNREKTGRHPQNNPCGQRDRAGKIESVSSNCRPAMDTMAEVKVYIRNSETVAAKPSRGSQTPALQKRRLGGLRQERTGEREELNGLAGNLDYHQIPMVKPLICRNASGNRESPHQLVQTIDRRN